jgi:signal transduction histidine kinase
MFLDTFTGTVSNLPITQPFQFNRTALQERIDQTKTLIQQAKSKPEKETMFAAVYQLLIDEPVAQVKAANLSADTRLFLADFMHETAGFATRGLNFLAWDNLAETTTSANTRLKARGRLFKPQPTEGPPNTMTIEETDALLSNTLDQVYEAILRYEPFIRGNWIQEGNTAGCQKAFELAAQLMTQKAAEKGIQLVLPNAIDLEKTVQQITMPPYKFYTLLSNLGLNALKYTQATSAELGEGKVTMQLSTPKAMTDRGEQHVLQIDVTDNGIGIPHSEKETVVSGKRAQNAILEGIEGTGYGLQRVKKLCLHLDIASPVQSCQLVTLYPTRPGTRITAQLPLDGILERLD